MNPKENDLILRIAGGEKTALKLLYDQYKSRVYNTALVFLRNEEEAEEITQDVFVDIYQKASDFQNNSSAFTWIYRITVNKSLDALRFRKRQKRSGLIFSLFNKQDNQPAFDLPHFDHPHIVLENKEMARSIFAAIDLLADQQKTAFILAFIEELSQNEIAAVMKTTEKAVESLLQRAKNNLRKYLQNLKINRRE